jgi:TonB family protein
VVASTDSAFDAPTLAALGVLRFTPAERGGGTPVAARVQIPVSWQPPAPPADPAAQGVVSASGQQVNGEPVYRMTPVVAEVDAYELGAVEEMPQVRNAGALRREMNRLYPAELRARRISAQVHVRFRVDAQGVPGTFRVTRSSDPRFDAVSVEALPVLRFRPAKVDGKPVPVWVELPLHWEP